MIAIFQEGGRVRSLEQDSVKRFPDHREECTSRYSTDSQQEGVSAMETYSPEDGLHGREELAISHPENCTTGRCFPAESDRRSK